MIRINEPDSKITYEDRYSSYAIIKNNNEEIAVVEMIGWGYIFPGGKIEENENSQETIKRETLEEIGYEVSNLEYYEKFETFYQISSRGRLINCHNIADFYLGNMKDKITDPIEKTKLHWFKPNELYGKLKLDFQNVVLEKIYPKE